MVSSSSSLLPSLSDKESKLSGAEWETRCGEEKREVRLSSCGLFWVFVAETGAAGSPRMPLNKLWVIWDGFGDGGMSVSDNISVV